MNGHLHLSVNLNKPEELRHAIEVLRNFLPLEREKSYNVTYEPPEQLEQIHIDKNTGEITKEFLPTVEQAKRDKHGRFLKRRKK